jgi:transcriptional regulator with XRE-family HTH domain
MIKSTVVASSEANVAQRSAQDGAGQLAAIGGTIRGLRREHGLSLRDLSRLTGFSIGFLSLVERGQSSPALTSLYKIARALGSEVGDFFQPEEAEPHPLPNLTRSSDSTELEIAGGNRTYRLLSGRAPDRVLEPLLVTVQPTETIEEPYSHEGEEFAYVLSGQLVFVIDGSEYRLAAGDSIHFQASVPHAIHNDTTEAVQAVWVLTPRLI